MPELSCNLRVGPAISEPVQLADGRILLACETPAREKIVVHELALQPLGTGSVATSAVSVLPGGPTDNGTRAMWPRLSTAGVGHGWSGSWVCGYQQGALNAVRRADWGTTFGPSHGIWPIGVADDPTVPAFAWDWKQAPPTTSQGVFGYLDGKWWLFGSPDDRNIWESAYALAYPKGVLFHGWRNAAGVLHLLFKSENQTVLVTDEGQKWNRFRVFSGHAEYPRGCSLPDGRVYVHAVDEHGQYRAALGPFPTLDNGEPSMPQPTVTILPGWPTTITLGESIPVAVTATNATAIDAFIEQGLTRIEATVSLPGRLVSLTPIAEGQWNLRARATNADSVDESQTPRIVTVLPAPPVEPPRPPLQVVTDGDIADLEELVNQLRGIADRKARYVNARNEGLEHESALARYRTETAMAILGDAVSR